MDGLQSTPLSELLLCAIVEQLQGVLTERGYLTNAGQRVFRARAALNPADLPCLVVWDAGETATSTGNGGGPADGLTNSMIISQSFLIEAHVAADLDDTGKHLGCMKADIKRAVLGWAKSGGFRAMGKQSGPITYVDAQPAPRERAAVSEAIGLTFIARYPEGYGDPSRAL